MTQTKAEPITHKDRQKAYHQRMRKDGFARVSIWIKDNPETRAKVTRFVQRLNRARGA